MNIFMKQWNIYIYTVEYIYNGIWHTKDYSKLTVFIGKDVYTLLEGVFF